MTSIIESPEELKARLQGQHKHLSAQDWEDKIQYRGLAHKFDQQLVDLEQMYILKLPRLQKKLDRLETFEPSFEKIIEAGDALTKLRLERDKEKARLMLLPPKQRGAEDAYLGWLDGRIDVQLEVLDWPERLQAIPEKIARIEDKLVVVLKERELREKKLVKRTLHGTTYYIDLDAGDDAANGEGTGTAWLTIGKYTTVTARSAGDIAKVRANTSQAAGADIIFDESGGVNNYIEIRGCSIADDPWSDSSDVKPIISFGDAARQFLFASVNYWRLYRLDIKESDDSYGAIRFDDVLSPIVEDCDIHDNDPGAKGIGVDADCYGLLLKGCTFTGNKTYSLDTSASVQIENCTFSGGTATTDYAMRIRAEATVELLDCSFGTHDMASIRYDSGGARVYSRNSNFADATEVWALSSYPSAFLKSEDHDQAKLASKAYYWNGNVTKDTGVAHSGGANSSAKMEPNANCGATHPLEIANDFLAGDFVIWCPASETTITIYIRSLGVWSSYPTNAQLYIQAEYYDGATSTRVDSTASTQVLADETTWVAFTTTFTPNSAAWVYVKVYLAKYESAKGCYVDVKPVVS